VAPPDSPAPTSTAPKNAPPINIMIGDLFYGTEGWAAMSDQGFQAFKGESNELIMVETPERGQPGGDATGLHMENFLAAVKSRNYKDLHDEIGNAYLSASLCHLANISYRTRRKLTLAAGPKFVNDAEANKLLTRDYRKPYVV
jgi:GFO/IDH/MocA oxidoreductase family protein